MCNDVCRHIPHERRKPEVVSLWDWLHAALARLVRRYLAPSRGGT